jgi:hypothetical protein
MRRLLCLQQNRNSNALAPRDVPDFARAQTYPRLKLAVHSLFCGIIATIFYI